MGKRFFSKLSENEPTIIYYGSPDKCKNTRNIKKNERKNPKNKEKNIELSDTFLHMEYAILYSLKRKFCDINKIKIHDVDSDKKPLLTADQYPDFETFYFYDVDDENKIATIYKGKMNQLPLKVLMSMLNRIADVPGVGNMNDQFLPSSDYAENKIRYHLKSKYPIKYVDLDQPHVAVSLLEYEIRAQSFDFFKNLSEEEFVSKLKENEINYYIEDGKTGDALLHLAIKKGYLNAATLLVEKLDINKKNYDGSAPLHIACENRKEDAIRFLIDRGANQKLKNRHNILPIKLAPKNLKELFSFITNENLTITFRKNQLNVVEDIQFEPGFVVKNSNRARPDDPSIELRHIESVAHIKKRMKKTLIGKDYKEGIFELTKEPFPEEKGKEDAAYILSHFFTVSNNQFFGDKQENQAYGWLIKCINELEKSPYPRKIEIPANYFPIFTRNLRYAAFVNSISGSIFISDEKSWEELTEIANFDDPAYASNVYKWNPATQSFAKSVKAEVKKENNSQLSPNSTLVAYNNSTNSEKRKFPMEEGTEMPQAKAKKLESFEPYQRSPSPV